MPAPADSVAAQVLITRPAHQCAGLSRAMIRRGLPVVAFPLIRILAPADPARAARELAAVAVAPVIIFTSSNAVRGALEMCPRLQRTLRPALLAAIGPGTAAALENADFRGPVLTPRQSTSESLLGLPALAEAAARGERIGIVKGEGGRTLLATALGQAGARVLSAEVYRRAPAAGGFDALLAAHGDAIRVAVLTSAEAVVHLRALTPDCRLAQVLQWRLVVPSERVAEQARGLGFRGPMRVAPAMDDDSLAESAAGLLASG